MSLDISVQLEAEVRAQAALQGVSPDEYLRRLLNQHRQRASELQAFHAEVDESIAALDRGEGKDGEEFMAELRAELTARGVASER